MSGSNGFDGDSMGMTQERQREIQASLFKMLGQQDDPSPEQEPAKSKKQVETAVPMEDPHL